MAKRPRKGKRLTRTGKYKISTTAGSQREFIGTLMATFNLGKYRIAVFRVPKNKSTGL